MDEAIHQSFREDYQKGFDAEFHQRMRQGRIMTKKTALLEVLDKRFSDIPEDILLQMAVMENPKSLRMLHRQALVLSSIEEFREQLMVSLPS